MPPYRKIIHIDMDAFYASVEQRDFSQYRRRPLIVGGPPNSRSVVTTCSYEARTFGIRSAMSSTQAQLLCPHAIFTKPRFTVYRQVSQQIHQILRYYTDVIEPLSLDEAFLDVSESIACGGSATRIASAIRARIWKRLRLTASAGISYNKLVAKLASDANKPDGQLTVTPEKAREWLSAQPINRFSGIGKVMAKRMRAVGIHSGADLEKWSKIDLIKHFGTVGVYYYNIARGIDDRPVTTTGKRKSISVESTFASDIRDLQAMLNQLASMTADLCQSLRQKGLYAQTVVLKFRYTDFRVETRSQTLPNLFNDLTPLKPWLPVLLGRSAATRHPVRMLGVGFTKLTSASDGTGTLL